MIYLYEVTSLIVCGDDGLISCTIKKIKEVTPPTPDMQEEGEEEDDDD